MVYCCCCGEIRQERRNKAGEGERFGERSRERRSERLRDGVLCAVVDVRIGVIRGGCVVVGSGRDGIFVVVDWWMVSVEGVKQGRREREGCERG